jgi:hypothetical protein
MNADQETEPTRKPGTPRVEAWTGERNPIGFQGALESDRKNLNTNPSRELERFITAHLCLSVFICGQWPLSLCLEQMNLPSA